MLHFTSLPAEIISSVLEFLGERDVVNCTAVSKQLRKIIAESSKFQYTIELAKSCMTCAIPTSTSTSPTYSSRLKTLRQREHAWKSLTWNARHTLKLAEENAATSVYDFAGGIYAAGKEDDLHLTNLISFVELPSPGDIASDEYTARTRTWIHSFQDMILIDFTMDPSQDLLAIVALTESPSTHLYEIQLRSIATNEPHPKAPTPVLPCLSKTASHLAASEHVASIRMQISGHLFALLVKETRDNVTAHLEIWDWKNSPQSSFKLSRAYGIEDFTFLSDETFVLLRPTGFIEVYNLINCEPISSSTVAILRYSYALPELSFGYMYWYMTIASNPSPGYKSQQAKGRGQQFYTPNPKDRIYACSLCASDPPTVMGEGERISCFIFFINLHSLANPPEEWKKPAAETDDLRRRAAAPLIPGIPSQLLHLPITSSVPFPDDDPSNGTSFASSSDPAHRRDKPSRTLPIYFHWEVWGPMSTRWFEECLHTNLQHSVYGTRAIEKAKPHTVPRLPTQNTDASSLSTSTSPAMPGVPPRSTASADFTQADGDGDHDDANDNAIIDIHVSALPGFLRLRDFNPHYVEECLRAEEEGCLKVKSDSGDTKGKGKAAAAVGWSAPRVVTASTTTDARGVFSFDVESRLPYVEVLSEGKVDAAGLMMDDCRIMLQKWRRGELGIIERVDVLTM